MVSKVAHRHMKSDGKIGGFQSGPESDEKWWENVWFQHASKNDGLPWQNGWFQKAMKTGVKIDGFKNGPEK